MKVDTIFEFVRFSMDDATTKFRPTEELDWEQLFDFAKKQAIVGIMYHGIEKMAGEQKPPRPLLMKWFMTVEKLKAKNQKLNEKAIKVAAQYSKDGFKCCILKGQGNAMMYPNPWMRTPGDVDIWVSGSRADIMSYVKEHYPKARVRYYHSEYHENGIPVEAHFMPGIMNNPLYNRRLQRYYAKKQEEQCSHWIDLPDGVGKIPVPTTDFNIVFQLSHMMHHFFDEGIGLRQMMDYYYLLRKAKGQTNGEELKAQLRYLNLYHFAGAVMYVMKSVFNLADEYLIVPVDESRGITLMDEICKGGNFGHYSGLTKHSTGVKYLLKNWRSLQLICEYPAEALSEPLFRTYHFLWRIRNK